ncbi:MAG: hypothetical protein JW893_04565 [Candidatus Omnitrophica bacterium]|nr:hypothetical protein [Candidatus Omnitrophota bacterium]
MNPEEFESLSSEEQIKIFHKSSFKEKGELILHSHHPEALTHSLSQEELYLTTREMDIEERSEIIRFASRPQLYFVTDVDCWEKDRISTSGFTTWMEILLKSGDHQLLAWLTGMDYETIVAGLKRMIRVEKPEREYAMDDVLGDVPYFTIDNYYFIFVKEEQLETMRRTFEILFENYRGRYVALLEGVLSEIEDDLEEEAYQKREQRLAERGFPEPEIAHRIYRPMTPEEFRESPLKSKEGDKAEGAIVSEVSLPPNYLRMWSENRLFLDDVLLSLRGEEIEIQEGIQEELAWLSNKTIACEGLVFSSEENVKRGVERARNFVNLGLEIVSGKDLEVAKKIVKTRWLENIFRVGAGALIPLREKSMKLVRILWKGDQEGFLRFLDSPYGSILKGLLLRVPDHYDDQEKNNLDHLRDFRTAEDIQKDEHSLEQIRLVMTFLSKRFPVLWNDVLNGRGPESLFQLLGTLYAQFVLWGQVKNHVLSSQEVIQFIRSAFDPEGARRVLKHEMKKKFMDTFFNEEDQNSLKSFWGIIFSEMEDELGRLNIEKGLRPEYIGILSVASGTKPATKKIEKRKKKKLSGSTN